MVKKKNSESLSEQEKAPKKKWGVLQYSILANVVLVVAAVIALSGMAVIHQSDTNPEFCGTCHIMDREVNSYLTGNHLDNAHYQAGVECKDCHDYPVSAEITSGISFLTGNYVATEHEGSLSLVQRDFGDEICTQCHISMEHVAEKTDYLVRNPHASHFTDLTCSSCHLSHGTQIDYCSQCHENGGQRMVEDLGVPNIESSTSSGDSTSSN